MKWSSIPQIKELLPTLANKDSGLVDWTLHDNLSGIVSGLQGGLAPRMADPPRLPYSPPQAVCSFWGIPTGGGATPSCPSGGSWGWTPHPASQTWCAPVVFGTLEGVSIYWSYLGVWVRPQECSKYSRGLRALLWRMDHRETSKLVRCRSRVGGPRVRSHGGGVCCECVLLIVDCHNRWQGSWVRSVGWDCCTLHSSIHYWCNNGGLSLNVV